MKKLSAALLFSLLAVLLMGAAASTSLVYVDTTSRALTGNIVAGNGTSISATGTGTITANGLASGSLTSAQLATALTNETGTGAAVFATSPTLVTPNIGAATGTSVNLTGGGTIGGNLTVSGTTVSVSNNSSPRVNFSDVGTRDWFIGAQSGSDRLVFGTSVTSSGGHAIRITSDNNVAIPNGNLTVSGGTATVSGTSGYLKLTSTSASKTWDLFADSGGSFYIAHSGVVNAVQFLPTTGEVKFAGQVNSGTSTSSGYNNNYNNQLEGLAGRVIINKASGSSSGALYAGFGYNGNGIGSVSQDGTTGVLYNTTSDARLKENIRDITNSGAIIDALKPRVFDWKNSSDKNRVGFIAQEVFEIFPQAVKEGDNGAEVSEQWAMDASKLVPVLVAEIKALRARVSALESK